jgi:hypothetical protein
VTAAPIIAGWKVLPDYAEPATAGGSYVEVQDDGEFTVADERDQSLLDMGADHFGLTRIPVEVIRALLASYDAKLLPAAPPTRAVAEIELAHMREGCRLLRASESVSFPVGADGISHPDWRAYDAWLDADDPDATEHRLHPESAS